jgi:hypothetical protein
MIKCKPIRDSKKAIMLVAFFAILSLVAASVPCVMPSYKGIGQIAFIVVLSIGISFCIRYTMTEMEYTLTEDSFQVRKKVGNKETVVCSLAISETVVLTDKKTYKANAESYGYITRKYNFNQNICAQSVIYICKFNGNNILVEFEPNQPFYNCFLKQIDENKK